FYGRLGWMTPILGSFSCGCSNLPAPKSDVGSSPAPDRQAATAFSCCSHTARGHGLSCRCWLTWARDTGGRLDSREATPAGADWASGAQARRTRVLWWGVESAGR